VCSVRANFAAAAAAVLASGMGSAAELAPGETSARRCQIKPADVG